MQTLKARSHHQTLQLPNASATCYPQSVICYLLLIPHDGAN
jgi:hypothetical protein